MEVRNKVRDIETSAGFALVRVLNVPDRPGVAYAIFDVLDKGGVNVDLIIQNASITGTTELSFTIREADVSKAANAVGPVAKDLGASDVTIREGLGKVAIIGTGIHTHPKYVSTMFRVLASEGINIECISTSEIRITCLIDSEMLDKAALALARAFETEEPS